MSEVEAFAGVHYNTEMLKELDNLISPPYDIIKPQEKEELFNKHPYNIINLILPKNASDTDWYKKAAQTLSTWLKKGILVREEAPAIYVYEHNFVYQGQECKRTGFIAAKCLPQAGSKSVLPHERTFYGPKQDRLKLMRAIHGNTSPIFVLFSDAECAVDKILEEAKKERSPLEAVDTRKTVHRLWPITNPEINTKISQLMQSQQLYIADGHHRFEVAQLYAQEMHQKYPQYKEAPWDYMMMYFTNLNAPGVTILPTHRMLYNINNELIDTAWEQIENLFTIELLAADDFTIAQQKLWAQGQKRQHSYILYYRDKYYLLTLKDEASVDNYAAKECSPAWRRLDVSILHSIILENLLGLKSEELYKYIVYIRQPEEAIERVQKGEGIAAFILNATKVEEVKEIALLSERMPQKSTDFFPKLLTGLVMNIFPEEYYK